MEDLVGRWLSDLKEKPRREYETHFRMFEAYARRTGPQLLKEHRKNRDNPDRMDEVPRLIYHFAVDLLDGKIPMNARGSESTGSGTRPLKAKINKAYSQKSVSTMIGQVKAFFAYYNEMFSLRKFKRKDVRLQRPIPQTKKYKFSKSDLEKIFSMASLRDKAIVSIGLMGQDESTTVTFRIEELKPYLKPEQGTIVREIVRPKTNTYIGLVLTPEVQEILMLYIESLRRDAGWLFQGYGDNNPLQAKECDRILKSLTKHWLDPHGERVSFHCCRAWFSDQLVNLVSDELRNYGLGHGASYDSAYLLRAREKFSDPRIIEALRIVGTSREDHLQKQTETILESLRKHGILNDGQFASIATDLGLKLPLYSDSPITENQHET